MTPRTPVITNPRLRSVVVAALMLALLGVSLAAAAFVSAHRTGQTQDLTHVEFPALSLRVPQGWQPVPPERLPESLHGARVLAEPEASGRLLVVVPLGSAARVSLPEALQAALERLLSGPSRQSLQGSPRLWRGETMFGLVYMGLSTQDMRKHYLAVITSDGRRFWAIYLTGAFKAPLGNLRQMNLESVRDRALLQAVLDSARPLSGT